MTILLQLGQVCAFIGLPARKCNACGHTFACYRQKHAVRKAHKNPRKTGRKFFLASSKGLTSQMAATGISPQGTIVPPPTKMAVI